MLSYIVGILSAFAEPVLHAWANILDGYFSNKLFKRLAPLVFISAFLEILLLPLIWRLDPPALLSGERLAVLFVIAFIEVAYLYPYYWALRHADTSIVASLFSLGRMFLPFMAFLFVGEVLTLTQYAGFFVLTISSLFLTLDIRKMRFNKAFLLMFVVSFVLALQSVLLKYLYEQGVGWGSSVIWTSLFQFAIATTLMFYPANMADLKISLRRIGSFGPLFFLSFILGYAGNLGSSFALYLIPVSIAKAIASTQPIFVLGYALLFAPSRPHLFQEYLGKDGLLKKGTLFVLVVIGTILIVL